MEHRIAVIGYSGSGKSTLGRRLADSMDVKYCIWTACTGCLAGRNGTMQKKKRLYPLLWIRTKAG